MTPTTLPQDRPTAGSPTTPPASGIVPELLDTHDAARLLGIGTRTLWRWSNSGISPRPIKIGRGLLRGGPVSAVRPGRLDRGGVSSRGRRPHVEREMIHCDVPAVAYLPIRGVMRHVCHYHAGSGVYYPEPERATRDRPPVSLTHEDQIDEPIDYTI